MTSAVAYPADPPSTASATLVMAGLGVMFSAGDGGNVLVVGRGRLRNQEELDRRRVGKRPAPAWRLRASGPFGGLCGHGNLP